MKTVESLLNGVSFHLEREGSEGTRVVVDDQGVVCDELKPGDELRLVVDLEKGAGFIPFRIQLEGDLRRPVRIEQESGGQCVLPITVGDFGGKAGVRPDEASIRLVQLNPSDGELIILQVGLVCQARRFCVAAETSFHVGCFQDDGTIIIPKLVAWDTLHAFLNEEASKEIAQLPIRLLSAPDLTEMVDLSGLKEGQARVGEFNIFKGYGTAYMEGNNAVRIHWRKHRNLSDGLVRPKVGDDVSFKKILPGSGGKPDELNAWG